MRNIIILRNFLCFVLYFIAIQLAIALRLSAPVWEIFCIALLLSLPVFFLSEKAKKIYCLVWGVICIVPNLLCIETYLLQKTPIKAVHIVSILLSNRLEVWEFLSSQPLDKLLLGVIAVILPLISIYVLPSKNFAGTKKYRLMAVFILGYLLFEGSVFHYIQKIYVLSYDLWRISYLQFYRQKGHVPVNSVVDLDTHPERKTYIVIISDSVGRRYMSLYGGKYRTTPFLDSIKKQLFTFDNVTTRYDVTYKVIEKFLSFSECDGDVSKIYYQPPLLDIYKKAGFKVFWLSSFSDVNAQSNFSYLTEAVDVRFFKTFDMRFSGDEILYSFFKKALEDKISKKIIFLHLEGSHLNYTDRYPNNFGADDISLKKLRDIPHISQKFVEYMTSIRYGDEVLKNIFSILREYDIGSSFVLYFSDHAEDVDMYGDAVFSHGGIEKKQVFEIPFFIWLSQEYKKHNPDVVKRLKKNLHQPYELNLMPHTLLELSRLKTDNFEAEKSFFNQRYVPQIRYYDRLK